MALIPKPIIESRVRTYVPIWRYIENRSSLDMTLDLFRFLNRGPYQTLMLMRSPRPAAMRLDWPAICARPITNFGDLIFLDRAGRYELPIQLRRFTFLNWILLLLHVSRFYFLRHLCLSWFFFLIKLKALFRIINIFFINTLTPRAALC
ncbi:hypothetical protein BDQ12DRAFT_57268 [Crucibulum laeve]|uniref:Uncharacterized protein n=1 Tax=Crucibulum laeve TaxID=68775 RepID=A0A5C3M2H5_9AGAR|nr:hypothetical protein BDQ12DRAFT_57268 [Crucibulum laeve]